MIGVDTNVLVYAANIDHPDHVRCLDLLSSGGRVDAEDRVLCLTWSVVYEFLKVATHLGVLQRPFATSEAWAFVSALIALEHVKVLGPGPNHTEAAARMLAAPEVRGNLVHDAHIAAVLAEHGVRRIYTRDQDFRRFPGLEVVDPLSRT